MRPHDRNESDDDRPIPPRRIASAVRPPPLRRYTVHQPLGAKQPYGWSARARELIAASGSHQSRTGTGVVRPSSESGALGETAPMAARRGHAMHRHLDGYRISALFRSHEHHARGFASAMRYRRRGADQGAAFHGRSAPTIRPGRNVRGGSRDKRAPVRPLDRSTNQPRYRDRHVRQPCTPGRSSWRTRRSNAAPPLNALSNWVSRTSVVPRGCHRSSGDTATSVRQTTSVSRSATCSRLPWVRRTQRGRLHRLSWPSSFNQPISESALSLTT